MDEKYMFSLKEAMSNAKSRLPFDLRVEGIVLMSMMLQLVLAIGGSLRYRSSNSALKLVMWISYMSADAVAVYALATMAHWNSANSGMFGVWAPLLLLHLGGPDTITAYSTPDNELWLRHLLTMLYQVSVASYVIYLSSLAGYPLAAAILLLFVGVSKYAERTQALRCSSLSKIVTSADPMNVFMQSSYGKECKYLVMGGRRWPPKLADIVTIQDVWESEQHQQTENYLLCFSHALFKMYKRRYVNLYLHERYYPITRRFFISGELSHIPSPDQVFRIVEMELKFMYDLLFTKSSGTAFSKWGVVIRLINIAFLGVAGFLIFSELTSRRLLEEFFYAEYLLSHVLVSVALVVEFLQLCRIMVSDWTMVWLICARIRQSRGRKANCKLKIKLMEIATRMVSWSRRGPLHSGQYWKNQIQQYSIIDTCTHISPCLWKFAEWFFLTDLLTGWYTETKPIHKELKTFIFEQLKEKCSPDMEDIDVCRKRLESYDDILERENNDLKWASMQDQEHLILHWHVATRICEMHYHYTKSSNSSRGTPESCSGKEPTCPEAQHGDSCEMHFQTEISSNREENLKEPIDTEAQGGDTHEMDDEIQSSESNRGTTESSNPEESTATEVEGGGSGEMDYHHTKSSKSSRGTAESSNREEPANTEAERNIKDEVERNIRLSETLSRYCAYLLVSCPKMLPLHADIAKVKHMDVHSELVKFDDIGYDALKDYDKFSTLGHGAKLARQLLEMAEEQRWKMTAEFWAAVIINYAMKSKSTVHAERLTVGGEFLSHLWVLLGHMGCGDQ